MQEEVQCNKCGWTGSPDELVSLTDNLDDEDYSHCPKCKSSDIEDIE